MLKTTLSVIALAATAGFASAHNYKEQLNDLNNSWECQDHYDRGDAIAGNIDKFEFCVWYLNNDKQGFFRDLNWYDITDSGDVIAIDARNFTSERKATEAIKVELYKLVEAQIANEKLTAELELSKTAIDLANASIEMLEIERDGLIDSLTDAETDLAEAVEDLRLANNSIRILEDSLDNLNSTFSSPAEVETAISNAITTAVNLAITTADHAPATEDRIKKHFIDNESRTPFSVNKSGNNLTITYKSGRGSEASYSSITLPGANNYIEHEKWQVESMVLDGTGIGATVTFGATNERQTEAPIRNANSGKGINPSTTVFTVAIDGTNHRLPLFNNIGDALRQDQQTILNDFANKVVDQLVDKLLVDSFKEGYITGYADGYDDGYSDGYDDGYKDGYAVGFDDGANSVK